jgi:signal transduction histidine kinase
VTEETRRDVNMRLIHALTDYAALEIGKNAAVLATERALAANQVDEATSSNPYAWVSLAAFRAVADALAGEVGRALVTDAVTWVVPTRRDLSAMSLTALATPRLFYASIDHARELFARHLRLAVAMEGRRRVKVRLEYRAGLPRHAHSCEVARGVLHAVPLLFDLPPAEIQESACFAKGADACEYTVTWRNETPLNWAGALVGVLVLAIGALALPSLWWALAPLVGFLAGREIRMTRLRRRMTRTTEEQRRVIVDHEREFARRYDDLRASNEGLERGVRERTTALETTLQRLREQNSYLRTTIIEMEKLQAELLDAGQNKLLGDAVGELAHEFKNPLTVVSQNLNFLEEGVPRGDIGDLVDVTRDMRAGVERMRTVLGWFVSLYRSKPSQLLPLDLAAEVSAAVTPLARHFGGAHVDLDLQPARIAGHEGQLGQVAVNLVTNASHAMGKQGIVKVRVHARDGRAVLSVEDDGPGIPTELHEKVFERGFATARGGEWSGSGLGLYIARTIVERHAGRISVRTGAAGGAIFEITLPLLADEREAAAAKPSDPPSGAPQRLASKPS